MSAAEVLTEVLSSPSGSQEPSTEEERRPKLPFVGPHGVFARYLDSKLIDGGFGEVVLHKELLPTFDYDVRNLIEHVGIGNVKSGFYRYSNEPGTAGMGQLFMNLGSGAVLYEGLPFNDGRVFVDYYGDTLGLRNLDITPYTIKVELLSDLNEAFKMLTKFQSGE